MNNNSTYPDDGGIYDIRIIIGIARLTFFWAEHREKLFTFAKQSGNARWREDEEFQEHMFYKYFPEDTPITLQMYRLDPENQQIVLAYVKNVVMGGLASWYIRF